MTPRQIDMRVPNSFRGGHRPPRPRPLAGAAPDNLGGMADPTPFPEAAPFLAAAQRLADRYRSMPQRKLEAAAPAGLDLARALARAAGAPVELPDAGIFAVGDQIALTAHDLVAELALRDADEAEPALADALARVRAVPLP